MKKLISVFLCAVLLFAFSAPAASAEDSLQARMTVYAGTDRGFVLKLTLDGVTGVSDAFAVRIQKLKKDREQFGYDIAPEQIAVVPCHDEDGDDLEIYLFEFDRRECDHVHVKGLLTEGGESSLVQRFWSEKQRLNALDHTGFLGLVEPYWRDDTISLDHKNDGFYGELFMAHRGEVICTLGNRLGLWKGFNRPAPSPISGFQIDSDILTPMDDGTLEVNALGRCTVHAVFSDQISYTWNVRVVAEEELRDILLHAAQSDPLFYMEYYFGMVVMLFSLPPITVTLPFIIPLAVLIAPAAYAVFLLWVRFH